MKKTLVAIGCSHTAGSEIYNNISEHPRNRAFCYAKQLADKLDMDCINLAVNGGTNDYIFRTTIEFINKNRDNLDNYRFLIGWTSSLRIELRFAEDNDYTFYKFNNPITYDKKYVQITSGTTGDLIDEPSMKKMITKYLPTLLEYVFCYDKFANYAFALQSIFDLYQVKYFMFNAVHGQSETPNNIKTIQQLIKNPRYYKPTDHKDTFFFYCRDVLGFTDITQYWHHKRPAHDAWANILYERTHKWLI